ncbi:unnamed protein product [Enterobius vermicularis]|uniref:Prohormone-4 n=1 Tax=Enterobius vermicularis TaxID=51028 RepID=A0A0N4VJ33_ENTVE|nr:unnamed protein product [Enterobius vermicularis]
MRTEQKRNDEIEGVVKCPPWHPFQCPNGDCVSIKYLCDGSPDCGDGYDENKSMCTAAIRPPVEETASFLNALLNAHGTDFFGLVFGEKGKNSLKEMGGVQKVAVAFSRKFDLFIVEQLFFTFYFFFIFLYKFELLQVVLISVPRLVILKN